MSSKGKSSKVAGEGTALAPTLRFPEFHDSDGWKEVSLQKLARPITDRATTKDADKVLSLSGEHGIVLQSDYFGKKIAGDSTERYLKIRKDDFVYNDRTTKASRFGTIKRLSKYSGGIVSPIYKCFRFQPSENPAFWEWYFESGSHDPALGGLVNEGARSGRFNISVTQFLSTNVWRPDESEQQRIAECLDSSETLIEVQGRKVEALMAHKKGLMQQLFPQEGETQPRLRFPEFRDAGDWKEVTLAKFIEEFREKSTVQDEYEVMTSARSGLVRQRDYYDNDRITERDNVGFNVVPPNYITYRSRSDDRKFYFNENTLGETGIVSVYYPVFRILNGSNKFFIELFSAFSRLIGMYSVGTSQTVLSFNQLKKIKLPVPREAEQQRIANCLTSLDDLIAAEARKLDTLKTHKKGLMQQLFPSVEGEDA